LRALRVQRRKLLPASGVMISPLIDIVFLLLIFFMLVTKFLSPTIDVDLPKSVSADLREERSIHLAIDRELNLFIGESQVQWENLITALKDAKESDHPEIVRIRADKTVPVEYVIRAIDAVRAAGLKTVALEAETPRPDESSGGES